MQHKYIVVDDTCPQQQHCCTFETVAQAFAYMSVHQLHTTHLVYDLSSATVIHNTD